MPAIVVGFADRYVHVDLQHPQEALERSETASRDEPGVTDVWLFDDVSEAPWHASLALPPKGNRTKKVRSEDGSLLPESG